MRITSHMQMGYGDQRILHDPCVSGGFSFAAQAAAEQPQRHADHADPAKQAHDAGNLRVVFQYPIRVKR